MIEREIKRKLIEIAENGQVTRKHLEKSGISDLVVSYKGHSLYVTWYPPMFFGRGTLRSLSIDGYETTLDSWDNSSVFKAMLNRADELWKDKASELLSNL